MVATHHVELQLHVEDSPTVQHWHQVDGEDSSPVGRDGDVGTEEDVEVHGEGVQLVAQGGPDGPAAVGIAGRGNVDDAVLRSP